MSEAKNSHESKKGSSQSKQGSQGDQENNNEIFKEVNVFHVRYHKVQDDSGAIEHSGADSSAQQRTGTFNNYADTESQDLKMSDQDLNQSNN